MRKQIRNHRNLLRHGLQFGSPGRMSISNAESNDEVVPVKPPSPQRQRSSVRLRLQPEILEPASGPSGPPNPDDNPFFSGALDAQTGLDKINIVRPDIINYAPVLDAASAAGASVDPFFIGALKEQASRRAAAMVSPIQAKKQISGEHRPSVIGFTGIVTEPTGRKKSTEPSKRRSLSMRDCPLRRRSKS